MKKIIFTLLLVCSLFTFAACDKNTEPQVLKLDTPVVTISDSGLASWEAIENATAYKYRIGDKFSQITSKLSVQLNDGETICVMALGDKETYLDSDFSEPLKYVKPALPTDGKTEDETTEDVLTEDETTEDMPTDVPTEDTPSEDKPTENIPTEENPTEEDSNTNTPTEEHTCDFTGEWVKDETHHWHKCSCGEIDTKVAHSGGEATTTANAVCEVCGQSYGELKEPEDSTTDEPIDISKVVFKNGSFAHDGKTKSIEVENLPQGVTVVYDGNDKVEVGTYTVTAKLYDKDNNLLGELTAELKIYKGVDVELPLV